MTKHFSAPTAAALAAALSAAVFALPAQAADGVVGAIQTCSADFFKAVAADKNIPENMKIRDGERAYLKVEKLPLDIIQFEKPFKEGGLTVSGYVFNDEVIRYFGVPDMHTHFWGLIVKEDWKKVVDTLKLDWEAVDTTHNSAHANRQVRFNGTKEWKPYARDPKYTMPKFGQIERAFHVQPYAGSTMIFCSMQSAGAPEKDILEEVRPDLLYVGNELTVREEKTEGGDQNASQKAGDQKK